MNRKIVLNLVMSVSLLPIIATAATDGTYNITVDNIGFAGGEQITDGTYNLSDTIGTPLVGLGTTTNYKTQDGFWYMVNNTITLELDSNTKDLGVVAPGTPNTAVTTATVTTDAPGGYELLISEDNELTHTDAVTTIANYAGTIGTPTAWSGTGLGFTITGGSSVDVKWGTSPNNNYAGIPNVGTVLHDKGGYTSGGDDTVIEYKIDVPSTQKTGTYNNVVTYTAISKL